MSDFVGNETSLFEGSVPDNSPTGKGITHFTLASQLQVDTTSGCKTTFTKRVIMGQHDANDNVGFQRPEGGSHSAQLLEHSTDNNAWQRAVADNNRGTDMNKLGFPDANIVQAQYRPEQQQERFNEQPFEPRSGVHKAVSPAGLDGNPGEEWKEKPPGSQTNWRVNQSPPEKDGRGNTEYHYMGTAGPDKTRYLSNEKISPNGELVRRESQYIGGMKMMLEVGPRQAQEFNVNGIVTQPNGDGRYQSRIYYTPPGSNKMAEQPMIAYSQSDGSSRFVRHGER
jgi:hypothetical protein